MQSLKGRVGRTVLANPISQEDYEPVLVVAVSDQEVTLQWPATEELVHWNTRYVWRVWPGPVAYTGREGGRERIRRCRLRVRSIWSMWPRNRYQIAVLG